MDIRTCAWTPSRIPPGCCLILSLPSRWLPSRHQHLLSTFSVLHAALCARSYSRTEVGGLAPHGRICLFEPCPPCLASPLLALHNPAVLALVVCDWQGRLYIITEPLLLILSGPGWSWLICLPPLYVTTLCTSLKIGSLCVLWCDRSPEQEVVETSDLSSFLYLLLSVSTWGR